MSSHVSRDYRWPPGPMGSRCSPCSLGSHGSHIAAVSHGAQRQSNHSEFTVFVSPVSRLPRFPGSRGVRVLKVLQLPLVRWALTILGFAVVLRFRGVINVLSALAVLSLCIVARKAHMDLVVRPQSPQGARVFSADPRERCESVRSERNCGNAENKSSRDASRTPNAKSWQHPEVFPGGPPPQY